ncbi:MAG: hypothetical protein DRH03_00110 [Deltaproteobacteria bacterium]|nr:MAG: hypothetical protein DRH03_00110 [Deltaproteobacteria bacterium]
MCGFRFLMLFAEFRTNFCCQRCGLVWLLVDASIHIFAYSINYKAVIRFFYVLVIMFKVAFNLRLTVDWQT